MTFVAAFAPFNFGWLAVPVLAALFWLWDGGGVRRGLFTGFAFGIGMFGAGVSWIYFSLHDYGNMHAALAALTVAVFVALLALYPAAAGALSAILPGGRAPRMLAAAPALWTLFEWLREWMFTGFPWLGLGYAATDGVLANYAPLSGVHGAGFATAVLAGAVATVARGGFRQRIAALAAAVAILAGAAAFGAVQWSAPAGAPISVAVVQGNVALRDKWAPGAVDTVREHYLALHAEAAAGADLVVWPEGAVPGFLHQAPEDFWRRLRAAGADTVLGVLERAADGSEYNSAAAVTQAGLAVYRKRHLVPFGEYLPFGDLFRFMLEHLQIPMANFSAWRGAQQPLTVAGARAGVSICYEDAFPEQIRRALPAANFLINLSEDAWFGDSLAPHQRLQMAQMRARETGRPMARAANTGPSALIDFDGGVANASQQFQTQILRGTVQPRTGATPFVNHGSAPLIIFLGALALVTVFLSRKTPAEP